MAASAAELSPPPLVIQGCSWLCRDHGGLSGLLPRCSDWGLDHEAVDVLESESAKDWTLFECFLQCARRSGIEDVFITCRQNFKTDMQERVDKLFRSRKGLRGLRAKVWGLPEDIIRTQGDFMRYLHSGGEGGSAALLSRGFFYTPITTHVMGQSKDFALLLDFHRSCSKRTPSILSIWPYRTNTKSAGFAGSHRDVIVMDAKSSELLSVVQINSYEVDVIDWTSRIDIHNERWSPPPESITVRSDLQLMDSFFYAPHEFLNMWAENFDYQTMREAMENIITSEVKMNTVNIYTKHLQTFKKSAETPSDVCTIQSGLSVASPRNLWQFCLSESEINSDSVYMSGKSPHWRQYDNTTPVKEPLDPPEGKDRKPHAPISMNVIHDSVQVPASKEMRLTDVLIMKDVKLPNTGDISHSVIGPNAHIGESVVLEHVIVARDVRVPSELNVSGPCFLVHNAVFSDLEDSIWIRTPLTTPSSGSEYVCLKPKKDLSPEITRAIRLDLFPNIEYLTAVKRLTNDASLDSDTLLDALFDASDDGSDTQERTRNGAESASHASDGGSEPESETEDDFVDEARSMLLTVINDKRLIGNMELELRNYRLSALKKDVDVLEAILPVVFAKVVTALTAYVEVNQRYVKENGLLKLVEVFLESGKESSYKIYYDALLAFVKGSHMIDVGESNSEDPKKLVSKSEFPGCASIPEDELFVRITCAFGELNHATYLPSWAAQSKTTAPAILETPHMDRYIAFLDADESEGEDSDDDSSSSSG